MTTAENGGAPTKRRRRRSPPTPVDDGSDDAQAIVDAKTPKAGKKGATKAVTKAAKPPAGAKVETPEESPPSLFKTADHQASFPRAPDLQRGFQTIVKDLFESGYDVAKEWATIRESLTIKDALTPERLRKAANEQEDIADRAHQLYIVGRVEVQAYMRDTEATYGAIREAAVQSLEAQKASKVRTKQITDADVKAESARLYPDEWADICTRRDRAEAMLKHLENLAQLARSRCYTISNMSAPGARGI